MGAAMLADGGDEPYCLRVGQRVKHDASNDVGTIIRLTDSQAWDDGAGISRPCSATHPEAVFHGACVKWDHGKTTAVKTL